MQSMLFHIRRQQQVALDAIDAADATLARVDEVLARPHGRILVLATGSSMNATDMARPFFERVTGLPLDAVEPSTFVHHGARPGDYDLVLAVSQRGTSTSTIAAVDAVRERYGCPVVAVTGHPDNPLGEHVDALVDIGCGPEDVPYSTVGVSATAVALMLLALRIAAVDGTAVDAGLGVDGLRDVVTQLDAVVADAESYVERVLPEVDRIFALGYGATMGAVTEGELKIAETVRIPATGAEIEAFMHGPLFELKHEHAVWFAHAEGDEHARSRQLLDFVSGHCDTVIGATQVADEDERLLRLPATHPLLASLVHLVPLQVLAAAMSEARGIDLSKQVFPDFRTALQTKVRWDD